MVVGFRRLVMSASAAPAGFGKCPLSKLLYYGFLVQVTTVILRRMRTNRALGTACDSIDSLDNVAPTSTPPRSGVTISNETRVGSSVIQRYGISSNGRFSESIRHGNTVYISGQIGKGKDIQEATTVALKDVDFALNLAGTDKSKALNITIYLRNIERDYNGMNEVYDSWIAPGSPPCRATVQAPLAGGDWLIEVHCIAAI